MVEEMATGRRLKQAFQANLRRPKKPHQAGPSRCFPLHGGQSRRQGRVGLPFAIDWDLARGPTDCPPPPPSRPASRGEVTQAGSLGRTALIGHAAQARKVRGKL